MFDGMLYIIFTKIWFQQWRRPMSFSIFFVTKESDKLQDNEKQQRIEGEIMN